MPLFFSSCDSGLKTSTLLSKSAGNHSAVKPVIGFGEHFCDFDAEVACLIAMSKVHI
jgi:hypothetical protein